MSSRLFKDIDDSNRKEGAQSSGAEILDAFVYHNYAIAEQPGSVRLGKQVVSWGESTFIGNSINAINPVDAAAFRRPGAEIKEGLIPVNMFYVSQSLTDQPVRRGLLSAGVGPDRSRQLRHLLLRRRRGRRWLRQQLRHPRPQLDRLDPGR